MPSTHLRPLKDEAGFYLTPVSLLKDAKAPCCEPTERIRSCPVAMAATDFVAQAFYWSHNIEKRREFLPDVLTGLVAEAVAEIEYWRNKRETFEWEKLSNPTGK